VQDATGMAVMNLGACEAFIGDLRRSNLVDRTRLDPLVAAFLAQNARTEPAALAEHLIGQGLLSTFQAKRLLAGNTDLLLGPYALTDELGAGSLGPVYKAVSKKDQRAYALKLLPRRSTWDASNARRVVRSIERCQHAGVVRFADVGTSGNSHYLAWSLVTGETLDKLVQRVGRLNPGLAALYALQTAEALDACHQLGLVHGLIKPSNLMVGEDQQIRILDFGLTTLLTETELMDTRSSAKLAGDLDCSSPESITDPLKQSPASDRYSLGCVLYFLLTGQYPFPAGSTREKILAHQTQQPTPIGKLCPDVSAELALVVETLMMKAPEGRYSSSASVVAALRPLAAEPPPLPPPLPAEAPTSLKSDPLVQVEQSRTRVAATDPHLPRKQEIVSPWRENSPGPYGSFTNNLVLGVALLFVLGVAVYLGWTLFR
jgi:serine/threonine-protein kinase